MSNHYKGGGLQEPTNGSSRELNPGESKDLLLTPKSHQRNDSSYSRNYSLLDIYGTESPFDEAAMSDDDRPTTLLIEEEAPPTIAENYITPEVIAPTEKNLRRKTYIAPLTDMPSLLRSGLDRYGFRKESNRNQTSITEHNDWFEDYSKYLVGRTKKWMLLMKSSGLGGETLLPKRFPPKSDKVKKLVRRGIPAEWRGAAWWFYAGGNEKLSRHRGVYDQIVTDTKDVHNKDTEIIERDLNRTFPDNVYFNKEVNPPNVEIRLGSTSSGAPLSKTTSKGSKSGSKSGSSIYSATKGSKSVSSINSATRGSNTNAATTKVSKTVDSSKAASSTTSNNKAGISLAIPTGESNSEESTPTGGSGSTLIPTETPLIQSLRRVLVAFAHYQPQIGYCQSLNFLAGLLLLFMNEEKSFWMLVILTERIIPKVHLADLEGVHTDQGVLMLCIKEYIPQLWSILGRTFEGETLLEDKILTRLPPVTLVTSSWFMSVFVGVLPIETVLRVWDILWYEGSKTIFRISLTICKMCLDNQEFQKTKGKAGGEMDQIELFQFMQNFPKIILDPNFLIDNCFRKIGGYGFGSVSQDEINKCREFVLKQRTKLKKQSGFTTELTSEERKALAGGDDIHDVYGFNRSIMSGVVWNKNISSKMKKKMKPVLQ